MSQMTLNLSVNNNLKLFFLWREDEDVGLFITHKNYLLLESYHESLRSSKTWGQFISSCSEELLDFMSSFIQPDFEENIPSDEALLEDLYEEPYVISDAEFPLVQLVEETYTLNLPLLPVEMELGRLRTEYHHFIGLYPKEKYLEISEFLDRSGVLCSAKKSPYPFTIYNY